MTETFRPVAKTDDDTDNDTDNKREIVQSAAVIQSTGTTPLDIDIVIDIGF